MDMSRKWSSRIAASLLVTPMLAMSIAGAHSTSAAPATQAGKNWNAIVGHEIFTEQGEKSTWQVNRNYPESLTINVGDSVTWKFDSGAEPHTVSFLGKETKLPGIADSPDGGGAPGGPPAGPPTGPPVFPDKIPANPKVVFPAGAATYDGSAFTSSGTVAADIPGPKEYKLSFTTPGTYTYYCLLHAIQDPATGKILGQQGTVTVQAAGSAYPKTQAQIDAAAAAQMQADEAQAEALMPEAEKGGNTMRPGPNGTTVHHVNVGFATLEPTASMEYMRFSPDGITVNQGDTIEWSMPTGGFHMVTFGDEPELLIFEPQPNGPPQAFINGKVIFPAGDNTYDGTGYYNSGVLDAPDAPENPAGPPPNKIYSLTFTQPGRFEYVCPVHYLLGMDGSVTVQARTGGQPSGMPTTGSGDNTLLVLSILAGLLLASTGVGLRLRKVRS